MKALRWLLFGSIFALVLLQPGGRTETSHASGSVTLVRLNEVSFDPLGGDAGQEWVEVVNRGLTNRDLTGWTVSDSSGGALATLPLLILPPNAFLVVHFGIGSNDLDFSDGEGHFYTGSAIEAFDNLEDELALYDGAPGSGTIVDFMAYSFAPPFTPGVAHDWAVLAGIWTQDDFFPGGVPLDEGTSLGRNSLSSDTDTSLDWESDGGVEADGPTPGKVNLDILFSFQVGQQADLAPAADPAPLAADPTPEQEMLKKVLKQIKDKHMGVFPPGTVDPGFAGWDGQTFEQGNNSVKIDNIGFDITTGLSNNGQPAAGMAPPPSTPTGLGHVKIDKGKADLVEWKWKEVVIHELVQVALERDTSG
ncbi:MAG: lamin tail domain-containing protein, partial [Anaerolineae bacterium]